MILDYEDLEQTLQSLDSPAGAAAGHGMLCGLICVCAEFESRQWLAHVLDGIDDAKVLDGAAVGSLKDIAVQTLESLDDVDAEFRPLLPDDESTLSARTEALVDWCDGFLYGIGVSESQRLDAMPEDSQAFLTDLRNLTLAEIPVESDEADEAAFFELVEFVKVGVLLMREELFFTGGHDEVIH